MIAGCPPRRLRGRPCPEGCQFGYVDLPRVGPNRCGSGVSVTGLPTATTEATEWAPADEVVELLQQAVARAVRAAGGQLVEPLLRVTGAQGKLLRPMLTCAVAELGGRGRTEAEVIDLAAAAELLHCATLVHDDLIDGASCRRGVSTISSREGSPSAIVGGDLLIAAAGLTAARIDPQAAGIVLVTLGELCRGEALQESLRFAPDTTPDAIVAVAAAKTGALLAAAGRLGALSFHAGPAELAAVAEFGVHFGIALQLVDDLLDIVSTPQLAGKAVGVDFAAGNLTFPAAQALAEQPELRDLFRPGPTPAGAETARELLAAADDALVATVQTAGKHAARAHQAIRDSALPGAGSARLAGWPAAYVARQLRTKIGDRHRWLVSELPADPW